MSPSSTNSEPSCKRRWLIRGWCRRLWIACELFHPLCNQRRPSDRLIGQSDCAVNHLSHVVVFVTRSKYADDRLAAGNSVTQPRELLQADGMIDLVGHHLSSAAQLDNGQAKLLG